METLKTFYQLDEDFIFTYEYELFSKPYSAVCVAPPVLEPGYAARWLTVLDPVSSVDFGDVGTGDWEIIEDHRKTDLFEKLTGDKYEIESNESVYKGLGPIPEHLTTQQRPTPDHVWQDDEWWLDPEIEQTRNDEAAAAETEAFLQNELAEANQKLTYLTDAVELDIATPEEQEQYTAWRTYRVLLSRVPNQPNYPTNVSWPSRPTV